MKTTFDKLDLSVVSNERKPKFWISNSLENEVKAAVLDCELADTCDKISLIEGES